MTAGVAWISFTPVKGLRLQDLPEAHLTQDGIPGDRAFFMVDVTNRMISATRLGALVAVEPAYDADAGRLSLRFPDGSEVAGSVELNGFEPVGFYDEILRAQPVGGPFSAALSAHCGISLRMFAAPQ